MFLRAYSSAGVSVCGTCGAAGRWGRVLGDRVTPTTGDDGLGGAFACYNVYPTADGRHVSVGALEPQFWKKFCQVMGRPDWEAKAHFAPGEHQAALKAEVAAEFASRPLSHWAAAFAGADCCVEPVLSLPEAMASELSRGRGMVEDVVHSEWGAYKQLGCCCAPDARQQRHAPELGEHTREVLLEYGIPEAGLEAAAPPH
eukprot:m51a1_g11269 putative alpha-methylacyl- racemase (200) ;mRNA; r:10717-11384